MLLLLPQVLLALPAPQDDETTTTVKPAKRTTTTTTEKTAEADDVEYVDATVKKTKPKKKPGKTPICKKQNNPKHFLTETVSSFKMVSTGT